MTFLRRIFPDRKLTALRIDTAIARHAVKRAKTTGCTQSIKHATDAAYRATHAQMAHELAVRRG